MSTLRVNEKYETFWRRFFASLIDWFVFVSLLPLNDFVTRKSSSDFQLLLWTTFISLAPFAYRIVLHNRFGQTFGKMIMRVKVVDFASETAINQRQAVLREAAPLIIAIIPLVCAAMLATPNQDTHILNLANRLNTASTLLFFAWSVLEFYFIVINSKRRSVHDFIAKTVVIRTSI